MEYFKGSDQDIAIFSLYLFHMNNPVQILLHSIKYNSKFLIAYRLGKMLAERFEKDLSNYNLNIILPVPLYHVKKAERGFNQSYYFAKGIADYMRLKTSQSYMKRTRNTGTQTHLNKNERVQNVKAAFAMVKGRSVKDKNIMIVDDVITTGSTIKECISTLKADGANQIVIGSIALA
ncbi:MAG: ComF family protein [Melioribacteraceae bacterium]|nr:ComF family protein [Melioribacteraceae bacterium]